MKKNQLIHMNNILAMNSKFYHQHNSNVYTRQIISISINFKRNEVNFLQKYPLENEIMTFFTIKINFTNSFGTIGQIGPIGKNHLAGAENRRQTYLDQLSVINYD